MKGFRNIIMEDYETVDDIYETIDEVHRSWQTYDLESFLILFPISRRKKE